MTERLTIFSTIDDLRNASDEVLINDIDAVGREVVLEYILELRRNVQPTQLGLLVLLKIRKLSSDECYIFINFYIQSLDTTHTPNRLTPSVQVRL